MDERTAQEILEDAFYYKGVEPEDTEKVAQEVLDELAAAGFIIVYAPRVNELKERKHNPRNFLQGEWR